MATSETPPARSPRVEVDPRADHLWWGLSAVGFALACWGFHDLRHDDAFITFRYGQNLAEGVGPVFNPGQRILGTTSGGHLLLSAAGHAIVGHEALPTLMNVLGVGGWVLSASAIRRLLHDAVGPHLAILVGLAVLVGAGGSANWVALETDLAFAAALWAMCQSRAERHVWAAVLAGAAVVLRPDYGLLPLLLAIPMLRLGWPRALRCGGAYMLTAAPWYTFAWLYYGSPVPQSAGTKFQRVELATYLAHELRHIARSVVPVVESDVQAGAIWLLIVLASVQLVRTAPRLWILPAFGLLHLAGYLFLRPFVEHTWHLHPAAVLACAVTLGGVAAMALDTTRGRRGAVFAFMAIASAFYGVKTLTLADAHAAGYWSGARHRAYVEAAERIAREGDEGDVIVALEVGTLAYYAGREMHDLGGLVTTAALPIPPPPHVRWTVVTPAEYDLVAPLRPREIHRASPGAFVAVVSRVGWNEPRR
ncbi:MAG: hypothetical protein AB8I08_14760 [Sandaracinaceae bacterium]